MKAKTVNQSVARGKLLDRLEAELQKDINCTNIERDALVFEQLGISEKADMISHDFCDGYHLFLCKPRKSRTSDLYHLRLQTAGLVHCGMCVLNSVLIAVEHLEDVKRLVRFLNTQEQEDGVEYNIELKTWRDFGIDPDGV